ncbi:uncharacterized protein [Ptychodera flava]|uniref:uncharacterized protein isoform X2 n=1 Tax=Ptychodera flava TaxID=63121 RepID=UPI00396AA01E
MAEVPTMEQQAEFDAILRRVASELKRREWIFLANILGLQEYHVEDITRLYPGNFTRQKYEMLLLWKQIYDEDANSESLATALDKMAEEIKMGCFDTEEEKLRKLQQQRLALVSSQRPRRTPKDAWDPLSSMVNVKGTAVRMQLREQTFSKTPLMTPTPRRPRTVRPLRRKLNRWHRAMTGKPMRAGSLGITVDVINAVPAAPISIQNDQPYFHGIQEFEDNENQQCQKEDDAIPDKVAVYEQRETVTDPETGWCGDEHHSDCGGAQHSESKSPLKRVQDIACQTDFPYDDENEPPFVNFLDDRRSSSTSIARSISIKLENRSRPLSSLTNDRYSESDSLDPFSRLLANITEPYFTHLIHDMTDIDRAIDQLERIKGVFIEDVRRKCLYFKMACKDLQSLDIFWSEYQDGRLNAMFQKELVNEKTLKIAQASEIVLRTTIAASDYAQCIKDLTTPLEEPKKTKPVSRYRASLRVRQLAVPRKRRTVKAVTKSYQRPEDEVSATPKVPNPSPEVPMPRRSKVEKQEEDVDPEDESEDSSPRLVVSAKPKKRGKSTVADAKEFGRKLTQMMEEGFADGVEPAATTIELNRARELVRKAIEKTSADYALFALEIQRFIQALKSVKPVKVSKICTFAEVEMYARKAVEKARQNTPSPTVLVKNRDGKRTERKGSMSDELLNVQFIEEFLNTINELRIIRKQFDEKIWLTLSRFSKTEGPNQRKMKEEMMKILARWDKLLSDDNNFSNLTYPGVKQELKPYQVRCYGGVISVVNHIVEVAKSVDTPLESYLQYS